MSCANPHNTPSAVTWQWIILCKQKSEVRGEGEVDLGHPQHPIRVAWALGWCKGEPDGLQFPNAGPATCGSSHGQHLAAKLLLHSIWGASVLVHLPISDAAMYQEVRVVFQTTKCQTVQDFKRTCTFFKRSRLKHAPTSSSIHFHVCLCLLCRLRFELDKSG